MTRTKLHQSILDVDRARTRIEGKVALSIGEAWNTRSDAHRPPTVEARRPAILELLRQGLRPLDIAATMRLPLGEVLEAAKAAGVDGSGQQGRP